MVKASNDAKSLRYVNINYSAQTPKPTARKSRCKRGISRLCSCASLPVGRVSSSWYTSSTVRPKGKLSVIKLFANSLHSSTSSTHKLLKSTLQTSTCLFVDRRSEQSPRRKNRNHTFHPRNYHYILHLSESQRPFHRSLQRNLADREKSA
jgi:hypothetical protein